MDFYKQIRRYAVPIICTAVYPILALGEPKLLVHSAELQTTNCFSPQFNDRDTIFFPSAIVNACIRLGVGSEIKVSTLNKFPCRGFRKQKISARYRLSMDSSGVNISHRILFILPKNENEIQYFKVRFAKALSEIKRWYSAFNINYNFQYEIATSNINAKSFDDVVKISNKKSRSNSEIWYRYNREGIDDFDKELPNLAAHELLHLLGLPDDYVDENLYCSDRYGTQGTNDGASYRKTGFANPQIESGFRRNIMWEHSTFGENSLSAQTIPPDYLYALISPSCPNLCLKKNQIAEESNREILLVNARKLKPNVLRKSAMEKGDQLIKQIEFYNAQMPLLSNKLEIIKTIFKDQWPNETGNDLLIDKWHKLIADSGADLRASDDGFRLVLTLADKQTGEALMQDYRETVFKVNALLTELPYTDEITDSYIKTVNYWNTELRFKGISTTIESVVPLIDFLSNINAGQNKRIGETKPIFEPTTMYAPTLNDLFPHCLAL